MGVIATLQANVMKAQQICKLVVPMIKDFKGEHPQKGAMEGAIMTSPDAMPPQRMVELAPLLQAYFKIPQGEVPGPASPSDAMRLEALEKKLVALENNAS